MPTRKKAATKRAPKVDTDPVDWSQYPENEDVFLHPDDEALTNRNYKVSGNERPARLVKVEEAIAAEEAVEAQVE